MGKQKKQELYRFSDFCLDRRTQTLSRSGSRIALVPKAAQLLLLLIDRAPHLVTRDEVRGALWKDSSYIEFEGAINTCVRQVRAALGDSAGNAAFIETLPKRGYRFVAKLEHTSDTRSRNTWWAVAALVAMISISTVFLMSPTATDRTVKRLVVLPVEIGNGVPLDPIGAYGIAMLVSESLERLGQSQLSIINSRSIRQFIDHEPNGNRILAPNYIVRTRLESADDGLILHSTLFRVSDEKTISQYRETYSADINTVVRTSPVELTHWISDSLQLGIQEALPTAPEHVENDFDFEIVAAMWHLESGQFADLQKSRELFDSILARSPDNILAIEGKVVALIELSFFASAGEPTSRIYADVEAIGRSILSRGLASGKGYEALGFVQLFRDWDVSGAINNIESALLVNPNDARTHGLYASARAASGDTKGAVLSAEIAERLDPAAMAVRSDRCWFLIFDKRYREALDACASALELEPLDPSSLIGSAQAQAYLGNEARGLEIMLDVIQNIDPTSFNSFKAPPQTWQELGCLRAAEIRALGEDTQVMHYQQAKYLAQCGRYDEVLDELKTALVHREFPALFLRSAPEFDSLRGRPEFRELESLLPNRS